MKVLHILSAPAAGGAEVYVKDLLLNSSRFGIKAGVIFVSSATEIGRDIEYENSFIEELKQNNIPFYFLPPGSRRNLIKGFFMFRKTLREFRPDIIHSHLFSGVIYTKVFSPSQVLIYTHHSTQLLFNENIFRFFLKYCSGYVAISKLCGDFLEKYINQKKGYAIIYNGIDTKRMSINRTSSLQSTENGGKPVILIAVGRLIEEKNYPLLIDVVHELSKDIRVKFELQIAGEGTAAIKSNVIERINEYKLHNIVKLLGNRSDVPDLLSKADIFVMSSLSEGLPISLIEAQMSGLASVVTDVGGCSEIIDITKGGIVVESENLTNFVHALKTVITCQEVRKLYSENASQNTKIFEITSSLELHRAFYKEVLISQA